MCDMCLITYIHTPQKNSYFPLQSGAPEEALAQRTLGPRREALPVLGAVGEVPRLWVSGA